MKYPKQNQRKSIKSDDTYGTKITDNFNEVPKIRKVKHTQQITKTSLLAKAKLFFLSLFRIKR